MTWIKTNESWYEISINVVCASSKASDQPAQSDQSLCESLEYSMTVKLLTEHRLEFLSLKGGCTGSSESTLAKMPHCWKSRHGSNVKFYTSVPTKLLCMHVIRIISHFVY